MRYINQFNRFNESNDSSITNKDARDIIYQIYQYKDALQNINNGVDNDDVSRVDSENYNDSIIKKCQDRLYLYDKINAQFVIDSLFHNDVTEKDIIEMGNEIMNKFGTNPQMVEQAFEDCFSVFVANGIYTEDDDLDEE